MKNILVVILFSILTNRASYCQTSRNDISVGKNLLSDTSKIVTPLALVQKQVIGYNARNLNAFLEPYSEDVEIYLFPDKLISKGKENMQKTYREMFLSFPELHCDIKERLIQGNIIIDKEIISGMGNTKIESTTIFQIQNNKIAKVYFIE